MAPVSRGASRQDDHRPGEDPNEFCVVLSEEGELKVESISVLGRGGRPAGGDAPGSVCLSTACWGLGGDGGLPDSACWGLQRDGCLPVSNGLLPNDAGLGEAGFAGNASGGEFPQPGDGDLPLDGALSPVYPDGGRVAASQATELH